MTPAEAIAELEKLAGRPTTQARVWDSLSHDEQRAIVMLAGGSEMVRTTSREDMTREQFARCWHVLERFARLSSRIVAANDNARAEDQERAAELIQAAGRRVAACG